jgi:hypothetical protein
MECNNLVAALGCKTIETREIKHMNDLKLDLSCPYKVQNADTIIT